MKNRVTPLRPARILLPASFLLFMAFAFMTIDALALPQKEALTRENSQGAVTVALTYLNPLKGLDEKELLFEVGMNTHSVDLDAYDFSKILVLRDEKGNLYNAIGVEAPKGGGHHRGGTVRFPGARKDGTKVLQDAKYFEVLVKGVAGVPERTLRWDLPIQ